MSKLADNLHPVAGYATIIPQTKENATSSNKIIYNQDKQSYFVKGKISKMGDSLLTEVGTSILPPAKIDDLVLYSYSGFEDIIEDGDLVHLVKFSAIVAVYEN